MALSISDVGDGSSPDLMPAACTHIRNIRIHEHFRMTLKYLVHVCLKLGMDTCAYMSMSSILILCSHLWSNNDCTSLHEILTHKPLKARSNPSQLGGFINNSALPHTLLAIPVMELNTLNHWCISHKIDRNKDTYWRLVEGRRRKLLLWWFGILLGAGLGGHMA